MGNETISFTHRSILAHRSGLPRNECHWIDFIEEALAGLAASLKDCTFSYACSDRRNQVIEPGTGNIKHQGTLYLKR